MTDPEQQQDRGETADGLLNGAAPQQQVEFPGADQPPPGRPDGDEEPDGDGGEPS